MATTDVPVDGSSQDKPGARIEGGIDAIVLGADADGLAAAAYLGKAGLKTVLIDPGATLGGPIRTRRLAAGVDGIDGEHLAYMLDPEAIADLELYRYGLGFAARRLDTVYFFDDGDTLRLDGDLQHAAALLDGESEAKEALEAFLRDAMAAAALMRPAFDALRARGGPSRQLQKALSQAPAADVKRLARYATASAEDVLDDLFADGPVKTLLACESAFRAGASPGEPYSFMGLIRRLAGEAAGLQGACAYPAGGCVAVIDALRRAAQGAGVDIRAATQAEKLLIEGDRVAGVMLRGGGQLRAAVVVASLDARRVFLDMIGPGAIDIEFQHMLTRDRPVYASARLQAALKGVASDDKTRENMMRRIVYAPSPDGLRTAFMAAREGRVPETLMLEVVFPGALDPQAAMENGQLLSVIAHPLPFDASTDHDRREAISNAILVNLEIILPDARKRLGPADLSLPGDLAAATGARPEAFAARAGVMRQWAFAGACASAGGIRGLYFCGPEARIGAGLSFAAGRAAAKAALSDVRQGEWR